MLRSAVGSDALPDGRTLGEKLYRAGDSHEVCEDLARCFIEMGHAEPAEEERKQLEGAPENKARGKGKKPAAE